MNDEERKAAAFALPRLTAREASEAGTSNAAFFLARRLSGERESHDATMALNAKRISAEQAKAEAAERERDEARAERTRIDAVRMGIYERRAEAAEAALRAVEADAAVMREEALAVIDSHDEGRDVSEDVAALRAALATNAGAGLIAEVERLRSVRDAARDILEYLDARGSLTVLAKARGDLIDGDNEGVVSDLRAALADVEGGGA